VQARSHVSDLETTALAATETVIFLGLRGDFSGDIELSMADQLEAKEDITIVGDPVRALATKNTRIWAIRTPTTAKKLERGLKREMKKAGYEVDILKGTALTSLGDDRSATLKRALRDLEREEDKVWGSHLDSREGIMWVFHESKVDGKDIQKVLRKSKVKTGFHHIELTLAAKGELQADGLAKQAGKDLDLARASSNGSELVLDVYLRDLEGMLALRRGKHNIACPDVLCFLGSVPAGELEWTVTLDTTGFPFKD